MLQIKLINSNTQDRFTVDGFIQTSILPSASELENLKGKLEEIFAEGYFTDEDHLSTIKPIF